MPAQPGRSRGLRRVSPLFLAAAAGLSALQLFSAGSPARATGAPPAMAAACYSGSATPSGCNAAALNAINAARRGEQVRPMTLPTNYASLSTPEQLLVVTDLERVDRGLAPVVGLTPTLDAMAQRGAAACCDPAGPSGYTWQSNWEHGAPTALAADFEWMYNDGPSSTNAGCPPSCWAHRNNILGAGGKLGAGANGSSLTELFVQGYPESPTFTWSQELPYLHRGAGSARISVDAAPGTTNAVSETVYNPTGRMSVAAGLPTGTPFRLNRSSCWSSPAAPCALVVIFSPRAPGVYRTTLTLSWSGGRQQIPVVGVSGNGYWEVARDGGIFDLGGGGFRGSTGAVPLAAPIVGMASTPDHGGYWLVARDGGIFSFGDARFHGSAARELLPAPIVAMAATPDGRGYWLVGSDGSIYPFGTAGYFGSTRTTRLSAPIVGMAARPDGLGYWLIGGDGGVFNFGAARFFGSLGGRAISQPITAMAAATDGQGYWLAGRDGAVYPFGAARYFGSTQGVRLAQPITALVADRASGGYWLMATDGGVFSFHAPFLGSMGGTPLNQPVVGAAAS
jgi:hypothetical protein